MNWKSNLKVAGCIAGAAIAAFVGLSSISSMFKQLGDIHESVATLEANASSVTQFDLLQEQLDQLSNSVERLSEQPQVTTQLDQFTDALQQLQSQLNQTDEKVASLQAAIDAPRPQENTELRDRLGALDQQLQSLAAQTAELATLPAQLESALERHSQPAPQKEPPVATTAADNTEESGDEVVLTARQLQQIADLNAVLALAEAELERRLQSATMHQQAIENCRAAGRDPRKLEIGMDTIDRRLRQQQGYVSHLRRQLDNLQKPVRP